MLTTVLAKANSRLTAQQTVEMFDNELFMMTLMEGF